MSFTARWKTVFEFTGECADCDFQFSAKTKKQAGLYRRLHSKKCVKIPGQGFEAFSALETTVKSLPKNTKVIETVKLHTHD